MHPGSHTELSEELAQDMRSAVDFARAAYGYAFLSGGLSSIPRYLHMQVTSSSHVSALGTSTKLHGAAGFKLA